MLNEFRRLSILHYKKGADCYAHNLANHWVRIDNTADIDDQNGPLRLYCWQTLCEEVSPPETRYCLHNWRVNTQWDQETLSC